ncbi:MAG TPA: tripartite tricarboxylate transporter substrate binding protein [Xanthobacteraceae bacterium]|nr:tripartite tricarboxylate transporter substrate binding protein [Xanthobacteraceae bacterium]
MPTRILTIIAVAFVAAATAAHAQAKDPAADYPNRTVRIVVSAPPGGGPDLAARLVADKLQRRWGQPFIIENRGGAGGTLGTADVAAAEPDGYTLLSAQPGPLTTHALLYKNLRFDPAALEPVIVLTKIPIVLVVRTDFPANTVAELIAYAKANPGKITYGSQGIGTSPHLVTALFARRTGTVMTHIPYKGTAQVVNDLVAGHVDLLFIQLDSVRELARAGKVKMLAVASDKRLAELPDIPSLAEAGIADFQADTWNAIAAPPKTPQPIVAKLNAAMNDVFAMPDVRSRLATMNMRPAGGSPADMAAFVKAETARWGEVIRAAGIKAQ